MRRIDPGSKTRAKKAAKASRSYHPSPPSRTGRSFTGGRSLPPSAAGATTQRSHAGAAQILIPKAIKKPKADYPGAPKIKPGNFRKAVRSTYKDIASVTGVDPLAIPGNIEEAIPGTSRYKKKQVEGRKAYARYEKTGKLPEPEIGIYPGFFGRGAGIAARALKRGVKVEEEVAPHIAVAKKLDKGEPLHDHPGRTPTGPEKKIVEALPGASRAQKATVKGYGPVRGARGRSAREAFHEAGGGRAGEEAARKKLAGPMPKRPIPGVTLTSEEYDQLINKIWNHPELKDFEAIRTGTALRKMLGAVAPQKNELKLLRRVFDENDMKVVAGSITPSKKIGRILQEVWNFPRVSSASLDASFPIRQGLGVIAHSPEIGARGIKEAVRTLAPSEIGFTLPERLGGKGYHLKTSEKLGKVHHERKIESYLQDPDFERAQQAGVNFTDVPGSVAAKEDPMMYGSLAEKYLPGVAASSRSFSHAGNEERLLLWKKLTRLAESEQRGGLLKPWDYARGRGYIARAEEKGVRMKGHPFKRDEFDRAQFDKELGDLVNNLTGRGHVPFTSKDLEQATRFLNHFMFSPRLFFSRVNMLNPYEYTRANPFVRRQMVRSMTNLIAFIAITGQAIHAASGGKVGFSMDPRSADFAKLKLGRTRFDLLGGFQQPVVLMAKLITGTSINSSTGEASKLGPGFGKTSEWDILDRFRRGKMHPSAGMVESAFRGTDFQYQPFTVKKAMLNAMIPLLFQDAYQVGQDYGLAAAMGAGGLGALGAGLQSYGTPPRKGSAADLPDLPQLSDLPNLPNLPEPRTP